MLFVHALTFAACHGSNLVPGLVKRAELQPHVETWKAESKSLVSFLRQAAKKAVDQTHFDMAVEATESVAVLLGASEAANMVNSFVGAGVTIAAAAGATYKFNKDVQAAYNATTKKIFDSEKCKRELTDMVNRFESSMHSQAAGDTKRRKLGATMSAPSSPIHPLQQLGRALSSRPAEEFTIHTPVTTPPASPRSASSLTGSSFEDASSSIGSTLSQDSQASYRSCATLIADEAPLADGAIVASLERAPAMGAAEGTSWIPGVGLISAGVIGVGTGWTMGQTNDHCRNAAIEKVKVFYNKFDAAIDQQAELFLNKYAPL